MKKYILFTILLIAACDQIESSDNSSSSIEYIYEPSYQKEWKIGSSENIMIVQQMHKAIEDGDFDLAYSFMSDYIIVQHGDGSQTNSLEEFKELYDDAYKSSNFRNVGVGVNISVISEEGHEWVLLWDRATYDGPDGSEMTDLYQEAFRIEDGKIIRVNQFFKPLIEN